MGGSQAAPAVWWKMSSKMKPWMIEAGIVEEDSLSGSETELDETDEYSDGLPPTIFISSLIGVITYFTLESTRK